MSAPRFGIAEWFGRPLLALSDAERASFADVALNARSAPVCPFADGRPCSKPGGVCSIRRYAPTVEGVRVADNEPTSIAITCPQRFEQGRVVQRWIGRTLLNDERAAELGEIGFLERAGDADPSSTREVGRIDQVLVVPGSDPLRWCAVEVQGVYFSGGEMAGDWRAIVESGGRAVVPTRVRRPDYRSSGPKRLMPQLQIKVPTLRRWGKKTGVVVDRGFFDAMGAMKAVSDLSSADIAWFVVRIDDATGASTLVPDRVVLTTLDEAVEGLTAARPISQDEFESRIRARLDQRNA